MMQRTFRGEDVMPASLFMGLTNVGGSFDDVTLADLAAGEPVGNGYARQELVTGTSDWTVDEVNGVIRVISKTVEFTASANWDKAWDRMFLCTVLDGTSGDVFAISGPAPAPRTVLSGAGPSINYEFWLRG
jgi:hypothetical protein